MVAQEQYGSGLVVLTPLIQSVQHNVVRISRSNNLEAKEILHIAGGEHTGIIINRLSDEKPNLKCDVALSFSVWLSDGNTKKQENRQLRFRFYADADHAVKHSVAQQFFKDLVTVFPKDYVTFLKRVLKQMQSGYLALREVEIDMQFAKEEEAIQMPDLKEYESDSECENVNVGHVQDVLEHAYPNGLSVQVIAEALRCTEKEAEEFLKELERTGVAKKIQNEWIRVDTVSADGKASGGTMLKEHPPTVAIITCLFVEKQSIDAIIDERTTVHRYRSGGDSNIYTLGWIGKHRVVATKLAAIGDSREATTSAGSITTRLLGNFQDVEHVFVVGVGGGVAHYTDALRHVRLGDVVVSAPFPDAYVFAHSYTYDRETDNVNGFLVRRWNPESNIVAKIAQNMDDEMTNEWRSLSKATVDKLNRSVTDFNFSRPPAETDVLALPVGRGNVVVIPHPNQTRIEPTVHVGPVGAMVTCRKQLAVNDEQSTEDATRDAACQLRDRFTAEYGLRAVDAGFDTVVAAVNGSRIGSWALVRGIADYQQGQSRVGRAWQAYAGVQAAALVKSLILRLPVADSVGDQ